MVQISVWHRASLHPIKLSDSTQNSQNIILTTRRSASLAAKDRVGTSLALRISEQHDPTTQY